MACQSLNAPDSCGDSRLTHNSECADFSGRLHMGSAAEFHRVAIEGSRCASDLHDSDGVAVLVAEKLEDAGTPLHFGKGNFVPAYRGIFEDPLVHEMLHLGDLVVGKGGAAKIKAQLFGTHEGTLLGNGFPECFPERPVEQMGDRVMPLDGGTAGNIERERDCGTGQGSLFSIEEVKPRRTALLGVGDPPEGSSADKGSGVADLASHFGVADRSVEDHGGTILDSDNLENKSLRFQPIESGEVSGCRGLQRGDADDLLLLRRTRAGALLFHEGLEAGCVDGKSTLAGE